MATDFNQQVDRIRAKSSLILEKYLRLKQAYDDARKELTKLKAALIARDKEIENLRMQVDHYSIASVVKASGDDLQSTRAMVADLVREIDRCIVDLSD